MSCLADLFVGTDASEEKYYSLDFGDGVEEEDLEEVDDPRHAGNISFGAAGDTGGADSQLRWEKLRILFLRHCNLVEVGAGLKRHVDCPDHTLMRQASPLGPNHPTQFSQLLVAWLLDVWFFCAAFQAFYTLISSTTVSLS